MYKKVLAILKNKIPLLLKLITIAFQLSVAMSLLLLLFAVFTVVVYHSIVHAPELFLSLYWVVAYGTFYIIIFATIPGFFIVVSGYFLSKWKWQKSIEIKPYLKLFLLNLVILLAVFLVACLNYSNSLNP
ncbi:hypothetical protein [Flavobacterium sp.]|uniref:hypothetical protein n=1 Tax=Flavobacterium sp. TaxID=239 RepID=UPI0039E6704F